jgi:phosphate transport system protein
MSLHFDQELGELKTKLLAMGSNAEVAVTRAIRAFSERDDDLARQVKQDDDILDEFEKEVDEVSIQLLAKAPLASELRLIAVAMKISHDLERVGDEATTIARRALELNRDAKLPMDIDLLAMADQVLQMLREALETFVHRDAARARAIIPRDKAVDSLNKQAQRILASHMVEQPATISRCLSLMTIAKSLERIGDHATNIAEEVVYLHEGEDIRHNPKIKQG